MKKHLAKEIYHAKQKNKKDVFPTKEIPSLVEIAIDVVAENFHLYPGLEGVDRGYVKKAIIQKAPRDLPCPVAGPNIDLEEYWEDKCKQLDNCRREDHGNSYKQAYIERHIQHLLETHKVDKNIEALRDELKAARYDVFRLDVTELRSHLDFEIVFDCLQNLNDLSLTYGAKHAGQKYESSLFGMKMADAEKF